LVQARQDRFVMLQIGVDHGDEIGAGGENAFDHRAGEPEAIDPSKAADARIALRQGAGAQGHTTGQGQSQGSAPAQGQHQHRRGTNGQSTDQSHQSPSQ